MKLTSPFDIVDDIAIEMIANNGEKEEKQTMAMVEAGAILELL